MFISFVQFITLISIQKAAILYLCCPCICDVLFLFCCAHGLGFALNQWVITRDALCPITLPISSLQLSAALKAPSNLSETFDQSDHHNPNSTLLVKLTRLLQNLTHDLHSAWNVLIVFRCFFFLAKYDKTCACIVSHTYKQIRKLWENPDKVNATQNGMKNAGKFADDMDRSTSSSTGWYKLTLT